MTKRYKINDTFYWIKITAPAKHEIHDVAREFKIHPLITNELTEPSNRSTVENYGDYLFLVYHLPIWNDVEKTSRKGEIDLVISGNTLITVTYEELEPIERFERGLTKKTEEEIQSSAHLVYHLIHEINDFSLHELRHIERKVDEMGERLFKEQDYKLLEQVSYVKRDLLNFTIIAAPQRTILESLAEVGPRFWGDEYKIYFSGLHGDFLRLHFLLENLRATVESYSDTVSQLLNFKTTQVMRRITTLGFLTFPLILYSTIALEPTVAGTFIHTAADFWEIFGIISIVIIILAVILRKRNIL